MKLVFALFVVGLVVAYVSAAATPEIDPVEAEVKAAAVEGPVAAADGKPADSKLQKRGLFGYGWGGWGPGWGWGGWGGHHGFYGWGYPVGYGWGWGWGGFYY